MRDGTASMARPKDRRHGGELRAFLLAEATALLGAFNGHPWPLNRPSTYVPTEDALDGPFGYAVRQLAAGREHRFYRGDLPDDHPMRYVGGLYDALILTEDDELVEDR